MKVVVTGSRTWREREQVEDQLDRLYLQTLEVSQDFELIHGGAKDGADLFAHEWAENLSRAGFAITETVIRPDYNTWGPKIAPLQRNTLMILRGPDVVLAFAERCVNPTCKRRYTHSTHGTWDAVSKAFKARIEVRETRGTTWNS